MNKLIIGLLAAGAGIYWYITRAFDITNVKMRNPKVGFDGVSFDIDMDFNNNRAISVPLDRFVGDVELMGKSIAKIDYNTPLILTAESATPLLINVKLDTASVLSNIANIRDGLFLVGTATVNNLPIPVNRPILRIG